MLLILSTMFLTLTVSSVLVLASTAALNLALQLGHSNIPITSLGASPLFADFREGIGHVLTGVVTSAPHFGHVTKL